MGNDPFGRAIRDHHLGQQDEPLIHRDGDEWWEHPIEDNILQSSVLKTLGPAVSNNTLMVPFSTSVRERESTRSTSRIISRQWPSK